MLPFLIFTRNAIVDMNRFFQALFSRFLRNHLRGSTLRSEYQFKRMLH